MHELVFLSKVGKKQESSANPIKAAPQTVHTTLSEIKLAWIDTFPLTQLGYGPIVKKSTHFYHRMHLLQRSSTAQANFGQDAQLSWLRSLSTFVLQYSSFADFSKNFAPHHQNHHIDHRTDPCSCYRQETLFFCWMARQSSNVVSCINQLILLLYNACILSSQ